MARAKNYVARLAPPASEVAERVPSEAKVQLPPNPGGSTNVDLAKWLGHGIDAWVWAAVGLLSALRDGASVAPATVGAYGNIGVSALFEFLTTIKPGESPLAPGDFQPVHIRQIVAWLKLKYQTLTTANTRYTNVKSVLVGLIDRGHLDASLRLQFPKNPFPGASASKKGASPLSAGEMQRLATALKKDLVNIHKNRFEGVDSDVLVVYFLVVSMRSGANTTPLLEMPRDTLSPHPFIPNMMLMKSHKRRGNSTHVTALRYSELRESMFTVAMDAVAILNKVLASTSALVAEAPSHLKDRIWLYRKALGGVTPGTEVAAFSSESLYHRTKTLVARHALLGDDGEPLRVTPQRLRKTMENRLWRLSEGDLIGVAQVMGHAPQVADNHYLALDDAMLAEGAEFIGETFPAILRGAEGPGKRVIPLALQNTPTGSCKDTLFGAKAPNDGMNECEQFTHCLGCPSYAVVGTVADLHRLFSFQSFLSAEIDYYTGDEWAPWRSHHQKLVTLIDTFTSKHFQKSLIDEAKALAASAPHKFWAHRIERARRARGASNVG